jgi:uncharacterized protein YeaO (DUF488 family)
VFHTKSVSSPIDRERDGIRILVARFRGRGLAVGRYDVWMPSLGPSERLLRSFQSGRMTWTEFARGYRRELFMDGPVDDGNASIKNHGQKFTLRLIKQLGRQGHITLMCHCAEDERHCHRHELLKVIRSGRI